MRVPPTAAVLAALALVGCGEAVAPDAASSGSLLDRRSFGQAIREHKRVIVTLQPKTDVAAVMRDHGLKADYVYSAALTGFAGRVSDAARAGLLRDARVVRIDEDRPFTIEGSGTQSSPTWGLDRIDQRARSLDGTYVYPSTGSGVTAYIVDTGIRYSHAEFAGRARKGYDAFGGDGSDCQGHGTHVAGTVGGTKYGVAKDVDLVAVRVLNCSGAGTTASVVAGLDWVIASASRPAVINMSLGGGADALVDGAIARAANAGIAVAVAAGNSGADACNYSPARAPEAMTIGATNSSDARPSFSNWGTCVDWFAPGVSITSAAYTSDISTASKSGTSMAAPHTAGVAALYLELHPDATAQQVSSALASLTTKGVVSSSFSPRSDLLYSIVGTPAVEPGNTAPTAAFESVCDALECVFADFSTDSDGTVTSWQWTFGDGAGSVERNPWHAYAAAGTYRVTLVVRDEDGATATKSADVVVSEPAPDPDPEPDPDPANAAPEARFSFTCQGLSCSFDDQSSDTDGSIVRWEWSFGDGASSVGTADASHVFGAGGTYRVDLTVTDDDGATSSSSQDVSVGIQLALTAYRLKGRHTIDLAWSGAGATTVDVYLDGMLLANVPNTGAYTHRTDNRGSLVYSFRICEPGPGGACSADQSVTM